MNKYRINSDFLSIKKNIIEWLLFLGLGIVLFNLLISCQNEYKSSVEIEKVRVKLLEDYGNSWNQHKVDDIMAMMTDDCVFEASGGGFVNGEQFTGQASVRASFQAVFKKFPDAHWANARHSVNGNRGISEWTFTGTLTDGRRVEVNGCDLFIFRDNKIAVKNSYRKGRPSFKE